MPGRFPRASPGRKSPSFSAYSYVHRRVWRGWVYKGPLSLQWHRTSQSTLKRRRFGFSDRSTVLGHGRGRPEKEARGRRGSEPQSSNQRSSLFSVADPVQERTSTVTMVSIVSVLSWLQRDLGASIDYAKSRREIVLSATRIFDVLPREAGNSYSQLLTNNRIGD